MEVRYYSPPKEGKRLKYYHVSKHGGSFVGHYLRKLYGRKNIEDTIEGLRQDDKFLTVTVFRNPYSWYKSFHAYYLLNGERRCSDGLFGKDAWDDNLNQFVENVVKKECCWGHPYLTSRYKELSKVCNLIGTTETLRESLAYFLNEAGYEYDKEDLKIFPPVRVAAGLPEYTQELTDESKHLIHELESEAFLMWEEAHAKSQTQSLLD